jgi:hypothetical protein
MDSRDFGSITAVALFEGDVVTGGGKRIVTRRNTPMTSISLDRAFHINQRRIQIPVYNRIIFGKIKSVEFLLSRFPASS